MNPSHTSTLTHPPLVPYHGVTVLTDTQAMDVDIDRQRPADHPRHDTDIMDTTLDDALNASDNGQATEIQVHDDAPVVKTETTAATEPTQVLERPREGGDDGARESTVQQRKTPTLTLYPTLLLQSMG